MLPEAIEEVDQRKAHKVVGQLLPFAASAPFDDLFYLLQVSLDLVDEVIVSQKSIDDPGSQE